jgi:hypothetical protein
VDQDPKAKILRYNSTTRYDTAPFGTVYNVVQENGSHERFIQLSRDETIAAWKPMHYLLETIMHEQLEDQNFVDALLETYENKSLESFTKISNILIKKN